ncbi:MAG: hypothetical protein Q9201_000084 [Fulgogasparrea decipioides]
MSRAKPATPPTTPPTNAGVDGELPPPDPAAAVAEEDGALLGVPVELPTPPNPPVPPSVVVALADDEYAVDEDVGEDRVELVDERVLVVNEELEGVVLDVRLKEYDGVKEVLEEEEGKVVKEMEVEFDVGVIMTGDVVTWVEPELVCEDMTT